uniref:Fork-head domain-containing protein n=1 Tax=Parastrongyloides trichosuri TaxID=131310 RepID=A0A0N4Z961_PARTI
MTCKFIDSFNYDNIVSDNGTYNFGERMYNQQNIYVNERPYYDDQYNQTQKVSSKIKSNSKRSPIKYYSLVCLALYNTKGYSLSVSDAYKFFKKYFTNMTLSIGTWQNSIRHNLSKGNNIEKRIVEKYCGGKVTRKTIYTFAYDANLGHKSLEQTIEEAMYDIKKDMIKKRSDMIRFLNDNEMLFNDLFNGNICFLPSEDNDVQKENDCFSLRKRRITSCSLNNDFNVKKRCIYNNESNDFEVIENKYTTKQEDTFECIENYGYDLNVLNIFDNENFIQPCYPQEIGFQDQQCFNTISIVPTSNVFNDPYFQSNL